MKYDIYCSGMWTLLKNSFKREIAMQVNKQYASEIMNKAKLEYKRILKNTESIGNIIENPSAINLINCAMFISIYKTSNEKFTPEQMGKIYLDAMHSNAVVKKFASKNCFTAEYQNKTKKLAEKSKLCTYKNGWIMDYIPGKNINEFGVNFSKCGICELCKQENCYALAKQMCEYDYFSAEMMGASLKRTKTIANGDGICNFWYTKK